MVFSTIDYKGMNTFKRIDVIEALQILRCHPDAQGIITSDVITKRCDQAYIVQTSPKKLQNQQEAHATSGERELKPVERDALKKMIDLGSPQESMIAVRDALQKVSNEIRSRNLRKYLNAFRKDPFRLETTKQMVDYAKESLEVLYRHEEKDDMVVSRVEPFLYHVS